jgi:hypothetical protein
VILHFVLFGAQLPFAYVCFALGSGDLRRFYLLILDK